MNKIKLIFSILIITFLFGCEADLVTYTGGDADAPAYSFARTSETVGVCTPTIPVTVESTIASNQDVTVNISVNAAETTALPSEYSLPSSITIPAGSYIGSGDVTVNFAQIPDGAVRQVVVDLSIPNGGTLNTRGTATINFSSACVLNQVGFDFVFDQYPGEFAWQLYDGTNTFIAGDTGYGNYAGLTNFSTDLCLANGNYTLVLFDSYGDGFCCAYGNGSAEISLTDCQTGVTSLGSISSQFSGSQFVYQFTL